MDILVIIWPKEPLINKQGEGVAKCHQYYKAYAVNFSTKGEGLTNPQNPVNIVYEWPLRKKDSIAAPFKEHVPEDILNLYTFDGRIKIGRVGTRNFW